MGDLTNTVIIVPIYWPWNHMNNDDPDIKALLTYTSIDL
jgi:hypothetical protein